MITISVCYLLGILVAHRFADGSIDAVIHTIRDKCIYIALDILWFSWGCAFKIPVTTPFHQWMLF